ncbi:hypothetical protein [Streptomyces sp. NPDC050585]|uniref:hypothetical protein n=1 Tax=Streptomyces sp. NPDC050585 TaxID=3365632 RepID=UPI0037B19F58
MRRYLVGIDVGLAFGAAANGTVVDLAFPPVHVTRPVLDAALPGPWLARHPNVADAVQLGYDVVPLEAWVRPESGRFLDGWYKPPHTPGLGRLRRRQRRNIRRRFERHSTRKSTNGSAAPTKLTKRSVGRVSEVAF